MFTYIPLVFGAGRQEGWGWSGTIELRFLSGAVFSGETVQEVAGDETGWKLGCWKDHPHGQWSPKDEAEKGMGRVGEYMDT